RGIAAGMRSVQHHGYKVCSVSLTDLGREQVHGLAPTPLWGPGQLAGRRSHGSRNIGRITRQPIRPPAVGAFCVNSSHPPVRAGDLCTGRRVVALRLQDQRPDLAPVFLNAHQEVWEILTGVTVPAVWNG